MRQVLGHLRFPASVVSIRPPDSDRRTRRAWVLHNRLVALRGWEAWACGSLALRTLMGSVVPVAGTSGCAVVRR